MSPVWAEWETELTAELNRTETYGGNQRRGMEEWRVGFFFQSTSIRLKIALI